MKQQHKDSLIAAAVTLACALLILLVLIFARMDSFSRAELAQASIPEPEEEELFLAPELDLSDPGDPDVDLPNPEHEAPAPVGQPEPSPVESEEINIPGKNTEKAPVRDNPSAQKKPSPVKQQESPKNDASEQRLKSMSGRFRNANNGKPDGKDSPTAGAGTTQTAGSLNGRKMLSCPSEKVEISSRTVVKVRVTVTPEGTVTDAKATSGPQNLRARCERWAKRSRWTPKSGAAPATGFITFTISPQ